MISFAAGNDLAQLGLPRTPKKIVIRPALKNRLSECHEITVLAAPLGYGKTTAVVRWLENIFIKSDLAANTTVGIIRAEKLADENDLENVVAQIDAKLEDLNRRLLLVIDNYDVPLLENWERKILDLVREHRNLRTLFIGRDPHRHETWHAYDLDLDIITGKDLRLTHDESVELVQSLTDELTTQQIAELHHNLGGWPVLVRAAALAGGALETVIDYLRSAEIFSAHDADATKLIEATAFTEEFFIASAAFLAPNVDVGPVVRRLERAGMVEQITTGEQNARYRYLPIVHHIVSTNHSEAERQERYRELAGWYSDNGFVVDALRCCIRAEAWDLLRSFSLKHRNDLVQNPQLQLLFQDIPDAVLGSDPLLTGIVDSLAGPRNRTAQLPAAGYGPDATPQERFGELVTRASLARFNGDFEKAQELFAHVQKVLAKPNMQEMMGDSALLIRLQAALLPLMLDQLHECAVESVEIYRAARHLNLIIETRNSAGVLALINVLGGNGPHVKVWLERFAEVEVNEAMFHDMVDTCGDSAEALYELGDLNLEEARTKLDQLNAATDLDEMWPFIAYAHSEYALLTGRYAQGLREIDAAVVAHSQRDKPGTITRLLLASARANLLLAQGEGNRALAALATADQKHPLIRAVRARIELLRGDYARALAIAHEVDPRDQTHDRALRELRLIAAIAHLENNEIEEASREFRHFIIDDGVGMLRALAMVDRGSVERLVAHANIGQDEFDYVLEKVPDPPFVARVELAVLTRREQVVLELLRDELTLNEIAGRLVVSNNTIKSQVRSLYRKLEVNSRIEAVRRAAEYGLLN